MQSGRQSSAEVGVFTVRAVAEGLQGGHARFVHGRAHASRVAECSRRHRQCANQWCFQHAEVVELVAELFTEGCDASTLQHVAQLGRSPKHAHMVSESTQARYTHDQQGPEQDMGVPGSRHVGLRIFRTVAIPQKSASPRAEGVCVDAGERGEVNR